MRPEAALCPGGPREGSCPLSSGSTGRAEEQACSTRLAAGHLLLGCKSQPAPGLSASPASPKGPLGLCRTKAGPLEVSSERAGHLDWQPRECWAAAVKGIPLVAIKICSSSLAREALCSKPHTPYFVVCKGACWASCFHCSVLRKHVPSVFDPKSWIAKTDGHN